MIAQTGLRAKHVDHHIVKLGNVDCPEKITVKIQTVVGAGVDLGSVGEDGHELGLGVGVRLQLYEILWFLGCRVQMMNSICVYVV
ncbi:hypothetical protein [Gallid alphaherpesvirus 2]|nr:hypothetical protein MDV012.8 [Gallid alphaherpesvirus 2]AQN77084.1 hypothetical protein [Gallid alphaherpesvirus 2]AQN77258.1 hypothetical protein [Gallid alphaherpesvirus 2]AQN77434.1 hypothetical protein [Gallid alphaherpesvirus 2]AQN77605.1 hypothetical protein [Gallid alphaherpesvirus 2]